MDPWTGSYPRVVILEHDCNSKTFSSATDYFYVGLYCISCSHREAFRNLPASTGHCNSFLMGPGSVLYLSYWMTDLIQLCSSLYQLYLIPFLGFSFTYLSGVPALFAVLLHRHF